MRRVLGFFLLACAAIACEQVIGADFGVMRVDCKHAKPPPAPTTPLGGGMTDIIEAVHGVEFGEVTGFRAFGFDGDGKCTLEGEGPSCALAKWVDAGPVPDGLDGRDNAIGLLVQAHVRMLRDGAQANCVKPGTTSNDAGVGGYCETSADCKGTLCTGLFGAPPDAWFCSKLCMMSSECGPNAVCFTDPRGMACVPIVCIHDAGADASDASDADAD